jgi:hypothetical protein
VSVVYQIKDWNSTFENNKSRERERCGFVCVPNKQDGMGLANILAQPDGTAIYGIWQLMVGAASRQGRHRDGWLTDDGHKTGTAWAPSDMAVLWRCPEALIIRAIEVLSSPRVGWILVLDSNDFTEKKTPIGQQVPAECPPDTLEGKRIEEKEERENAGAIIEKDPQITPPTLEQVKNIATMRSIGLDCAEHFFYAMMETNWVTRGGVPVRDWMFSLQKYSASWRGYELQRNRSTAKPKRNEWAPAPENLTFAEPTDLRAIARARREREEREQGPPPGFEN